MDNIQGYEIRQSTLFENGRGFALGHNPKAPSPFVTWQFTEKDGKRDYEWGHYFGSRDKALADYNNRVFDYERQYGVQRLETQGPDFYKYYSTQRPVGIGTFPRPKDNLPVGVLNYGERRPVEGGSYRAWGELLYHDPLTEKQISDYELRPAPGNLDVRRRMDEQAQAVGKWEDKKRVPEVKRLTWYYSDFGSYVPKEFVTPEQLAACFRGIELRRPPAHIRRRRKRPPPSPRSLPRARSRRPKKTPHDPPRRRRTKRNGDAHRANLARCRKGGTSCRTRTTI